MADNDKELVYLPFYEQKVKKTILLLKIATFLFVCSSASTTTGTYDISSEEIEEELCIPKDFIKSNAQKIVDTLLEKFENMVAEAYCYEDEENGEMHFDITLFYAFISGFVQDDACFEE